MLVRSGPGRAKHESFLSKQWVAWYAAFGHTPRGQLVQVIQQDAAIEQVSLPAPKVSSTKIT